MHCFTCTYKQIGVIAYNSFRWRAIQLFNAIPKYIRCIYSCSVVSRVSLKSKLDCYLKNIVDLPGSLDSVPILDSRHIPPMVETA